MLLLLLPKLLLCCWLHLLELQLLPGTPRRHAACAGMLARLMPSLVLNRLATLLLLLLLVRAWLLQLLRLLLLQPVLHFVYVASRRASDPLRNHTKHRRGWWRKCAT
jgi:hypothetical protein